MENKMCAIVRDLLPLYKDEALREESCEVIEEHLKHCEACRQFKETEIDKEQLPIVNEDDSLSMKRVATRLKRRRFRIIAGVTASILLLYILLTQVLQFTTIVGESMDPTYHNMQDVIINRCSYLFSTPKRSDVVSLNANGTIYIKRIVGLPGETVDIKGGELYIDGALFDFEYIGAKGDVTYPVVLGEDEYFVLGDNPDHSLDNRYADFGPITRDKIMGKVICKTIINLFRPKIGIYDGKTE